MSAGSSSGSSCKRFAWAEINLGALKHNIAVLGENVDGLSLQAVVKANAYGHGAVVCARAALETEFVSSLCVALAEEGFELRAAGITAPILVLSEQPPAHFAEMISCGLTATLYNAGTIAAYGAAAALTKTSAKVHLKLDTGMHRVGAPLADVVTRAREICAHEFLVLDGVFSHLACADSDGDREGAPHVSVSLQSDEFTSALKQLKAAGLTEGMQNVHLANSAATVRKHAVATDNDVVGSCRVGIAMYGINGDAATDSFGDGGKLVLSAPLRPVLSLKARISHVQRVAKGQGLSYGLRKPLLKDSIIAALPIGYADGVIRAMWNNGYVLIGGKRCPFAGMITMDCVLVDCGDEFNEGDGGIVAIGDEAVLLGSQGDECILANDWAKLVGTIGYEVTCNISARVPRLYVS